VHDWPEKLIEWYQRYGRSFPWRQYVTPYRVWVSEIMLQQTRTETVTRYFPAFVARFPDVPTLAQACEDDVLKMWEGLGYYKRARNLHQGAREIVRNWRGQLPRNAKDLQKIPGIGPYTAAAVASIAYDQPEPVVDGNVLRLVSRLYGIREDIRRQATKTRVADILRPCVARSTPSIFNQALMDAGASVCRSGTPFCEQCPLSSGCVAYVQGLTGHLPYRTSRQTVPTVEVAVGLVHSGGMMLIGKRPTDKMLGGLWELPGGKCRPGESPAQALRREIYEETGLEVNAHRSYAPVYHAYTHFRVVLYPFDCDISAGAAMPIHHTDLQWVSVSQLQNYAFPRGTRKVFEAVGATSE